MEDLNKRYEQYGDKVSYEAGRWPMMVFAITLVVSWGIAGPFMRFSDTWQLLINTPTTIFQFFLLFLCLAAANRSQRNTEKLLNEMSAHILDHTTMLQSIQSIKNEKGE